MEDATVSGLVTLVAVGLGALSSFIVTRAIDNAKWKREQNARWDAHRLIAYTEYATAVKMEIIRARSILGYRKLSKTLTPLEPSVGLPLLEEDENTRSAKLEALMLLASHEVVVAARAWHEIAWTFNRWASGIEPVTKEEVEVEYARADEKREAYYAAARRDLRVAIKVPIDESGTPLAPPSRWVRRGFKKIVITIEVIGLAVVLAGAIVLAHMSGFQGWLLTVGLAAAASIFGLALADTSRSMATETRDNVRLVSYSLGVVAALGTAFGVFLV